MYRWIRKPKRKFLLLIGRFIAGRNATPAKGADETLNPAYRNQVNPRALG